MVQHRGNGNKHDDYWKLKNPRSFKFEHLYSYVRDPRSLEGPRAQDLFSREQLGRLAYERCTFKELKTFSEQRKLIKANDNTIDWRTLVATLEIADDKQTFDRFLHLPAELREIIYELHFAWLVAFNDGGLVSPRPPPITQVSSLLRHETLQLFHRSVVFELVLIRWVHWGLSSEKRSITFFLRAPDTHVALVRFVRMKCDGYGELLLDLGTKTISPSVTSHQGHHDPPGRLADVVKAGKAVSEWMTERRLKTGIIELDRSDIKLLHAVVQRAGIRLYRIS